MSRVVVVGSGASGVHFALTALDKGHEVVMLDVGHSRPATELPVSSFDELKHGLTDPVGYFLGPDYESVTLPGAEDEVYAFPPSKRYVFSGHAGHRMRSAGIDPLSSFAQGGLAEAWTAGVYPFNDRELAAFPLSYQELAPYYETVAGRIGVNGARDDLARFLPWHGHVQAPLELDRHSRQLLATYERRRARMHERFGCYLGRSRIATLTEARNERGGCVYCGRCMWGCPNGAFYTPALSLEQCRRHPRFEYRPGRYVTHFGFDADRRITSVSAACPDGSIETVPAERLVLAAGTLSTTRIFLDSIQRGTGEVVRLGGLMDNRQVLVPYVNLRTIGAPYTGETYQYHQLALGLEDGDAAAPAYVHGQLTTLTTGLVHPVIQSLPLDLRGALAVFRVVRTALGIVNLNLQDTRRPENYVTIEPADGGAATLVVSYTPEPAEPARIARVTGRLRGALRALGCIAPRGMVRVRGMGAGVHYSGTLPMSATRRPFAVSPACESYDFRNLYIADGSTFPFLPAKNLTFTLMANATRIADQAF